MESSAKLTVQLEGDWEENLLFLFDIYWFLS